MPQIIVRGMDRNALLRISGSLVDELETIVGCPRDYFTIEHLPSEFIADGTTVPGYPMIQVNWFAREQDVQDGAAAAITRHVQGAGYSQVEIYFIELKAAGYYENGKHY